MKVCSVAKITFPVLAMTVAILAIGIGAEMAICNVAVTGLQKCLPAVQLPDPKDPTSDCCAALEPARDNFPCFCQYINNPIVKAMKIDVGRAMNVPRMCKMKGVPSHC